MTPAPAILEAQGLVKHFGADAKTLFRKPPIVRAVDGVSLSIARGETFAIVGESGCGKSTLARLLLRLIEPTAGRVTYDGRDVTAADATTLRALRRDMQMVFQDPFSSLNPRMSVGAIVGEPISVHGIASGKDKDRRVAETLRLVGLLPEHAGRYPHEFSGGQRQRVGLARALASGPKLLLGDEPVSALDVSIRAQIINLLEDLKDRLGLTLVLVSHDLGVVRHTADRVAVMYLGEIVELSAVDELFDHAVHPYTRALLAAIPVPSPSARSEKPLLEGDPPSPAKPPSGCRFHTRCPHAKAICSESRPPLAPLADGHAVACHFARELASAGAGALGAAPASAARRRRVELFAAASAARAPSLQPPVKETTP
jgi:peptide/nickel transport system ATP-binding protein